MPCMIRNVSDSGAKLELSSVRDVPDQFELHFAGHHPHTCKVVWRALKELGVMFLETGRR